MSVPRLWFFLILPLAAQNPAAHWSFDGGTVAERLQESYGRTELNAAEAGGASSWQPRGGFGETLANGGSASAYLSVPNGPALAMGSGDFSISLWSYRTTGNGATSGLLDSLPGDATGWQLFYQANNTIRIRLDDNAGNFLLVDTTGTEVTLDTWKNIIVTVDRAANRAKIFVDGVEATAPGGADISALTGAIDPGQNLWIGTLNGNTAPNGRLDDVAIFNRLLTPQEISSISGGATILSLFPASPPLPAITISPASGLLRPGESVTLSTSGDLPIRYTLDGSDPAEDSPLYTASITSAASGEIRARAFSGDTPGPVASAHFAPVPAAPPNILILVGEAIGFGDLSCYGSVSTSTPHLGALAAQGARFTGLSLTGPGASSTPYALLTGRVPRRAGLPDTVPAHQTGWDRREWTLAEALRKTGYHTAFIGAWQLGSAPGSLPGDQGFALFHGLPWSPALAPAPPLVENDTILDPAPVLSNLPATLAGRVKNHLSAAQNGQPFFLVVHIPELPASGSSLLGPAGDCIEAFDTCAGEILDHLDQLGLADDTLTLFLSSYAADRTSLGPSLGSNAPFRDGAGSTWEGGLRVPAIARWPGVIPAATDNLAALWLPDLFHSLLAIGQGQAPSARPLDGQPRPETLLAARTRTAADTPMFHHRRSGPTHLVPALRSGPWKLHLSIDNTDPQNPAAGSLPRLHHLEIDPYERINLASTQTSLVTALQASLAGHEATFAAAVPQLPPPAPPFIGEPASSILPGGSIAWTLHRPAESLDDRYLVEFSTNLVDWSAEPIHPFIESTVPRDDDTETVTLRIPHDHPLLTGPRAFVRLRSEQP